MTEEDIRAVVRAIKTAQAEEFEALHRRLDDEFGAMNRRLSEMESGVMHSIRDLGRRVSTLEAR